MHKTPIKRGQRAKERLVRGAALAVIPMLACALLWGAQQAPVLSHAAAPGSSAGDVMDVRANQGTANDQQEPTLAVDPTNPDNVVVAAKDWRTGPKQVWYYRSSDGGHTWADGHVDLGATELPNASDPVLAFDSNGALYFAFIGYNQNEMTVGGIYVARSDDAGKSWGKPSLVAAHSNVDFNDKEWLTVDRSSGSSKGTVYVTWTRFHTISANEERGDIVESHSNDGGKTWSDAVVLSRPEQDDNQGSFPVVGPNGDLYVLYYNDQNTPTATTGRGLYVARSADGGKSFQAARKAATVSRPLSPLPGSKFRIFVLPVLAVDPNNGTLYATWNDFQNDDTDVMLVRSTDGGQTWTKPQRVNGDPSKARHDQFFPYVTVGTDSAVHLLWLDRRGDPSNKLYVPYYARSTDGGKSFDEWPLSSTPSNPDIGFQGTLIGDYVALDTSGDGSQVYAAWIDTRNGDQDIYYSSFAAKAAPAAPAPSTPRATPVAVPSPQPLTGFSDASFLGRWQRTDAPVVLGQVSRPWVWGPVSFGAAREQYAQGRSGVRSVQYFDKARMEINNPNADPNSRFYITNGLLVVEMISGRVQIGDAQFEAARPPASVPVAGDADSPDALTYASLYPVASLNNDKRAADRMGQPITAVLNRAGQVTDDPTRAGSIKIAKYEPVLGHNIPDVFWSFMNEKGQVMPSTGPNSAPNPDENHSEGQSADPDRPLLNVPAQSLVQEPLLDWVADLGYPITEPYWTFVKVGGAPKWVLVQAFQRRVLTYVADNPPGWQVEMGNVGRHYFDWRYGTPQAPSR